MNKDKNTLVEVGHIYLDEMLSLSHCVPLDIYKENYNDCDAILMVDDLNIDKENISIKEIDEFYREFNCVLCEINTERNMLKYVDQVLYLFDGYIKKEYFRKDKKHVYFFKKGNHKIALYSVYENKRKEYTCSLLSLCWLLYKHNYFKNFREYKKHIVIIPEKFKIIEDNVEIFCHHLNINISVQNIYF